MVLHWFVDPFIPDAFEVDITLQESFIGLWNNTAAQVRFNCGGFQMLWGNEDMHKNYPQLWKDVKLLLLTFPTSYLVGSGFSRMMHLLSKTWNRLDIKKETIYILLWWLSSQTLTIWQPHTSHRDPTEIIQDRADGTCIFCFVNKWVYSNKIFIQIILFFDLQLEFVFWCHSTIQTTTFNIPSSLDVLSWGMGGRSVDKNSTWHEGAIKNSYWIEGSHNQNKVKKHWSGVLKSGKVRDHTLGLTWLWKFLVKDFWVVCSIKERVELCWKMSTLCYQSN